MINSKILLLFATFVLIPLMTSTSFAEIQTGGFGESPFNRTFGDVKFLDAYFGTSTEKIEVGPGDSNVPFTVEFANVGSQDITGIRGQLLLPYGFSSIDGSSSLIFADSNSNSLAGKNFSLTFYVNIDKNAEIQQYPATVKVDYSRLRESGIRTSFSDFNFKVTGNSLINAKAIEPFLTSLTSNNVPIEISNAGSAPLSSLDVVIDNTQTTTASTVSSTNIENVIIFETNWNLGNIESHSSRIFTATIYVPESLKGDTLRIPLTITYYDSHGEQKVVSKIVDFYVKGLIDLIIYDVNVIELSGQQMVVGQIINEGNEDGLFGFVTLKSLNGSNIKTNTQFIDEIEIDAPVPFNVPIEFDGEPKYGEHEISITVRYKDSVRDEIFLNHDATIIVKEPSNVSENNSDPTIIIISILIVIGVGIYIIRRRKNGGIMTINYFKSKVKKIISSKMRLSIIILIIVLVTGSIIISSGFITNQEIIEISEISTQYEKLEKYKNELERINQYNLQILDELKTQIQNADDVYLVELHDEINVITDVINDNKIELEQIIQKLSEVKSQP